MKEKTKLRSGFTTGTCAAAAVKASVRMLCLGESSKDISLVLPGGSKAVFPVEMVQLTYPPQRSGADGPEMVSCAVRKDAGDDPDVTNGVLVYGKVYCIRGAFLNGSSADKPYYRSERYPFLFLTGGEGIGMVTKKGLLCAPGFYAINPVPRRMIFEAAAEEYGRYFHTEDEKLLIEISVPEGKRLAENTFNKNLGILGGISVLGTSGIVNPMSEQALLETIRLDIRVKVQEGRTLLAVAPGNYGEAFLKDELGISMDSFVKCSNFIGDTFLMMKEEQVEEVLFAGHLGKLIKVAGGVLNTHSKYGDRRMELFCDCAKEAGVEKECAEKLLPMNTTEEAAAYLKQEGCLDKVMAVVLDRIQGVLKEYSKISVEAVVFSSELGILGMTAGAAKMIGRIDLHKGG